VLAEPGLTGACDGTSYGKCARFVLTVATPSAASGSLNDPRNWGDGIMAAVGLRSWFDDSERDEEGFRVAAVAGCVGTEAQWERFNLAWKSDVLDQFELPHLHMKELKGIDRFKDRAEMKKLTQAIISAIAMSGIRPFASTTRLRDLRRFNKDYRQQLNAYSLNVYSCMHLD
jgi:hypothetical protein